jgi:hypothetical protein
MHTFYALGHYYHIQQNPSQAMGYFQEAKKIAQGLQPFDAYQHHQKIEKIMDFYSRGKLNDLSREASNMAPIFILGLPRSGKSLLERALSQHPSIIPKYELASFLIEKDRLMTDQGLKQFYPQVCRPFKTSVCPL